MKVTSAATTIRSADPGPYMDEPIRCSRCGAPARISERFRLVSTAGPVEHLKIGCVNHHWLTPLAETLTGAQPDPTIPAATQPAPA
jgi:hypothetical protein